MKMRNSNGSNQLWRCTASGQDATVQDKISRQWLDNARQVVDRSSVGEDVSCWVLAHCPAPAEWVE